MTRSRIVVLLILGGCAEPKEPRPTAEATEPATYAGHKVEILRAFDSPGLAPDGSKKVGAELRVATSRERFEFDRVELVDEDTGKAFGSDAEIQRVTENGELAAHHDVVFTDDQPARVLLWWTVDSQVRRVRLEYRHRRLGPAVELAATGPEQLYPVEWAAAISELGRDPDGARRLAVVHACDPCSRTVGPAYVLMIDADSKVLLEPVRTLEIDASHRSVHEPVELRPFYLRRTWLLEFRVPRGARSPLEILMFAERIELPAIAVTLPAATLAELNQPARSWLPVE